jgi:hypothetical protein
MPRKTGLRPADELILPALARTIAAVDPPETDAALIALLQLLAGTLDRMSRDELRAMLGQTAPQLHRGLVELETRAAKRRKPAARSRGSALDQLRAAHQAHPAVRKGLA